MFTSIRLFIFGLVLSFLTSTLAFSQNRVTFSVSQNSYVGDLNPITGAFYNPSSVQGQLGFDLGFEHDFDESVYLTIQVGTGKYEGNYSINSKVVHFRFDDRMEFPLPRFIKGEFLHADIGFNWIYFGGDWYQFYTGVGLGVLSFSVKDIDNRNLRELTEYRAPGETYPRLVAQVPFTLGFQLFTNYRFNLGYELNWIFTNTDYLDNIGQYGELGSDALFKNQIKLRFNLF